MKTLPLIAFLIVLSSVSAQARLLLTSKDGSVILDPSRFPADMSPGVEGLNKSCNACHDLTRIIRALETGRLADGSSFGKTEAREFVIKKMRRPGVVLSQQDARDIIRVMEYILDEAPESRIRHAPVRRIQTNTAP